ncbi:MAG: CRISPR-associated endonuclease Cas2 [Bacilli bacterium]
MRMILFYDLPSVTYTERRVYRKFHRYLEKEGFIQMQESVYTKLALNSSISKAVLQRIRSNSPKKGFIQVLIVTEKQFSQIECIVGAFHTDQINSEERLIVL